MNIYFRQTSSFPCKCNHLLWDPPTFVAIASVLFVVCFTICFLLINKMSWLSSFEEALVHINRFEDETNAHFVVCKNKNRVGLTAGMQLSYNYRKTSNKRPRRLLYVILRYMLYVSLYITCLKRPASIRDPAFITSFTVTLNLKRDRRSHDKPF